MALLALVAAAGRKGISRDRVIGVLWPESSEEQARHTLSQTLYSLKRDTGQDLLSGTTLLRLAPSVSSDIGELHEALATGNLQAAADLYTGRFLDGFYLPGAAEFERWVEESRDGLEREARRALERLVKQAEDGGTPADAVRWWQRLTELDPLSARYTAGYMRALDTAGDRTGALTRAKLFREVVHRELNAEPDRAVRELEASLRAAESSGRPTAPLVSGKAEPAAAEPKLSRPEPTPEPPAVLPRSRRWLIPATLVGIVLLGLVVRGFGNSSKRPLPFLAVGAIKTPELGDTSSLGPMLRDMLATSLGGLEGLQVVANSRLVELTPPRSENVPEATTNAARRAGANEIVEGELASEAGTLVMTFRRVDLNRGVVREGYLVRAGNRYALIDSATAAIALDLGLTPPSLTARDVRTTSPEAYALYNEGLRAFYGYDAPAAYRLMTAALERDSTFAMAAYYAWEIGRWLGDDAATRHALERARRLAPRTIERERLLIQAATATLDAVAVAAAIAETLAVRYATDPDAQILLGQVRAGQGDWSASIAAFERAVAIDSAAGAGKGPYCRTCLALGNMMYAYVWWDSAGAAERVARRSLAIRPDDPLQWTNLVEPLLRQGRRAEAELAIEKSGMGGAAARWDPPLDRDLIRWGRLEELDRKLIPKLQAPSHDVRAEARWLVMLSLRDQGRLREGLALASESRIPGSSRTIPDLGRDIVFTAALLQELGRPDSAAALFHAEARRLLASTDMPRGLQARVGSWHLTLAGTAYVAEGDTAVARRLADSIEVIGKGSSIGRDLTLHHFLRGLVFQRAGKHLEAITELRASLYSLTDGYTRANLALARSLLQLGRPAEAIAVLRPAIHGGVDGSNTYTSRTELHEAMAQAFELVGKPDSAVVHWRAVEQNWRRADPQFADRYRRAKVAAGSP